MGQSAEELRRDIERTRGDMGETLDAIGDRVSPGRMIERRKNRARNMLHSASERVMGTASDTRDTLADATTGAVDTVKNSPEAVRQQTQGNPLLAGAIAFGVGVLTASIFKPTEIEQQAAGQLMERAEPLKEELKKAGHEAVENLKEPALAATEQVREAATTAAQNVADTAKQSADDSKQAVQDAAETMRSDPTSSG